MKTVWLVDYTKSGVFKALSICFKEEISEQKEQYKCFVLGWKFDVQQYFCSQFFCLNYTKLIWNHHALILNNCVKTTKIIRAGNILYEFYGSKVKLKKEKNKNWFQACCHIFKKWMNPEFEMQVKGNL